MTCNGCDSCWFCAYCLGRIYCPHDSDTRQRQRPELGEPCATCAGCLRREWVVDRRLAGLSIGTPGWRELVDAYPARRRVTPGLTPVALDPRRSDAEAALVGLGYTKSEARAAVAQACAKLGDDAGVDDLVRTALRQRS